MIWLCLFLIWQVNQAITLCSEMHNIKEAIYENKRKLEGIGEDYQIQVGDIHYFGCDVATCYCSPKAAPRDVYGSWFPTTSAAEVMFCYIEQQWHGNQKMMMSHKKSLSTALKSSWRTWAADNFKELNLWQNLLMSARKSVGLFSVSLKK